ncbi:metallophosphoesterase [Moorena sp. SIO3A2]|uniref:metallophosphoesterase n=1 Tax=Moorena sp. SIO3A2 TaxID=2607841 RepID=UPI00257F3409|nr:metallophosphoesterase [Moorena sp. SIO3A2]
MTLLISWMNWIFSGPLKVEKVTVAIADLPTSLRGTKLVQLSDLHYDRQQLRENILADAIEAANQAEPDLVVLTGDYVTNSPTPIYLLARRLKYLESRHGIYAILGNHDLAWRHSKATITQALTKIGVKVLWNAIAYPFGAQLPLVGLADFWSGDFNPGPVLNQIDPKTPRIVLSHNPDTAEILQRWRVDLQLSGHTHGGQIVIPGIGPAPALLKTLRKYIPKSVQPWIPYLKVCSKVTKHWEWSEGLHSIGKNQLYTNRGLGTYWPGRLFCPPEVTVITLN